MPEGRHSKSAIVVAPADIINDQRNETIITFASLPCIDDLTNRLIKIFRSFNSNIKIANKNILSNLLLFTKDLKTKSTKKISAILYMKFLAKIVNYSKSKIASKLRDRLTFIKMTSTPASCL